MRLNGNGTHHNGNGHSNGMTGRVSFAPGGTESALSTKSVLELLELFEASGDQAPFEEIVRRYAGMVYNVCYQVSRDSHEAEDATQAVFLTLAVRSKTAQKIQYLGPWLQRVAQRLSLDMKRSKKRRAAREVKHHDINVGRWEENNQPHDLGMDELRGILRDEIDRLPAKYRMPLILHYFGGLKPDEMSKELGIKANTLGVRLHRARKMLGDNLQKKGIVVGGTMLTAALATLVPMYIQHTIAGNALAGAASYSLGHSLVTADVTAQVLGVMHAVNRAAILGKIKAVTAAIAIGAAAVAGAGQLVRTIQSSGFEFRNLFDSQRWLAPLFERLRSPIRFSDASSTRLDDALNAKPTPDETAFAFAPFMQLGPRSGHRATRGDDGIAGVMMASIGELGPTFFQLQRTPVAAPLPLQKASRLQTAAPLTAAWQMSASHRLQTNTASAISSSAVAGAATSFAPPSQIPLTLASIDSQFASASGRFRLTAGRLDRDSIILDSATQALRSFHIQGGEVRTKLLTIGERGSASVLQTGGTLDAEKLVLARDAGSIGDFALAGGEIKSIEQNIGQRGTASFVQTGGANTTHRLALAAEASSVGRYELRDGTLHAGDLTVGSRGAGLYLQSGGFASVIGSGDQGGVKIADHTGSRGTVNITGGTIEADKVFVGLHGDATYTQSGGQTITNKIVLGTADHSSATFLAVNGTVVLDGVDQAGAANNNSANEFAKSSRLSYSRSTAGAFTIAASQLQTNAIVVGLNGDAVLQLGNARDSATFSEGTDGSHTPLVVRATASAQGELRGWGDLALRGQLFLNGKLVGDGYGKSRVLDLSSVAGVLNTIDNDIDGAYGLYAQRNGRLRLPAIKVTRDGDYNWGESPSDPVPDLVNSVRLGFSGVRTPGEAKLTLVAPDDPAATKALGAPAAELFVGLWKFDRVGLDVDGTKLLVRYDEQMVEHLGLSESSLSIWAYDGAWRELGLADTVLNTDLNLIGGELNSRFEYFAVSVSALAGADWMTGSNAFQVSGFVDTRSTARSIAFINDVNLIANSVTTAAGSPAVVPEPAAGALLAAGAMLLGRRRRV